MASLLPLLHDLLPIFMPSKVQVARGSELVAVEERAQRAPWYQQQPRLDRPSKDCDIDIADAAKASSPDMTGEVLEPIRLLDYEEKHASPGHEEGSGASMPHYTGEDASLSAQRRNGPKVIHQNAMVGLSDKMCVTVLTVQPRSASVIHHHGEQETIIYATTAGVLLTSPALNTVKALRADIKGEQPPSGEEQPRRFELGTGDFAFVPAWTEHQVINESPDRDLTWVLFRGGGEPVQVDLDGWGGERIVE